MKTKLKSYPFIYNFVSHKLIVKLFYVLFIVIIFLNIHDVLSER